MSDHACEPRNYRENPPVCYVCGGRIARVIEAKAEAPPAEVPDLLAALRAETADRISARGGAA